MGMYRWTGSHFYDWIDYSGVAFLTELLEWGGTFSDFWGGGVRPREHELLFSLGKTYLHIHR